ncbi:MAG: SPOR domain-containing protein, partial [Vicinamibacterales bacterium]
RLGKAEPARERLQQDPPTSPATARPPSPERVASKPAAGVSSEPAGPGFAIQLAALGKRNEADGIARRLTGKGYPAYVITPDSGAPAVFRVRVGKFKDRKEAESIAARLQKEEQFNPWIVP